MQIPRHLKEKWVLIQDDETSLITYRLEQDKERDSSIYTKFNSTVKQVIKFPFFGMLSVDITEDFQRRNFSGQFTTDGSPLYPTKNDRSAFAVYKMWYYDNCGRSAEPLPAFYVILPDDVVELAVEHLWSDEVDGSWTSIEDINPMIVDDMKSWSSIFDPEDETRSNLIIRFEADPAGPTPTDTTWHYNPCKLAHAERIAEEYAKTFPEDAVAEHTFKMPAPWEVITTKWESIMQHITNNMPQGLDDLVKYRDNIKNWLAIVSKKINSKRKLLSYKK